MTGQLGDLTSPQAASAPTTLLVPLGATEQHGPHLPLDTDTRIASAWCRAVAELRSDVTVAPSIPYGSSGEHDGFAGTLSIGTAALTTLLVELARSAIPPFAKLIFVNGHGGNLDAVTSALETLRGEGRDCRGVWPRLAGDAHAGHTETSLMLAIDPALVRMASAEAGNTQPITELAPRLRADGLAAHSPNGVLGDPTTASATDGARYLEALVGQLIAVIDAER